jgi:hypothetical protein
MNEEVALADFSFTATINAHIEKVDLPAWIFGLADDEYQRCSPAHVATGATHSPDGRRMTINVEVLEEAYWYHTLQKRSLINIMYVSLQFLTLSHQRVAQHCM